MKQINFSIMLTIGSYGGFYMQIKKKHVLKRICLGWIALSWFPYDIPDLIQELWDDDKTIII